MRRFVTILAATVLALAAFSSPSRAQTVRVMDARGRVTYEARMVALGGGAWGVPLETYAKLGFYARLWKDGRPLVAVQDSDVGILLPLNGRRAMRFLDEQPLPARYNHPVAIKRNGRVYVAGFVVTNYFRDGIRAVYDAKRNVVTLRRRG
jgi:hypothetical protein